MSARPLSALLVAFALACSGTPTTVPDAGGPPVEPPDAGVSEPSDAGSVEEPPDAGPVADCRPGETPRACGPEGSGCVQGCLVDGTWGGCQPASGPADFQADPKNCGGCGIVCATPANAQARCVSGRCARGPCAPGFFDFDGAATPGCEAQCTGTSCTLGDGSTVQLHSPPVPETGLVHSAFATGSSYGAFVQTSSSHTNIAVLGESTPSAAPAVEQKSARWRNVPGLNGSQTR